MIQAELQALKRNAEAANWMGEPAERWIEALWRVTGKPKERLAAMHWPLQGLFAVKMAQKADLPDRKAQPRAWAKGLIAALDPVGAFAFLRHERENSTCPWLKVRRVSEVGYHDYQWEIDFLTRTNLEGEERGRFWMLGVGDFARVSLGSKSSLNETWLSLRAFVTRQHPRLLEEVLIAWANNPNAASMCAAWRQSERSENVVASMEGAPSAP